MIFQIIAFEPCSRLSVGTDVTFLSAVNSIKKSGILSAENYEELEILVEQFATSCTNLRNPSYEFKYY